LKPLVKKGKVTCGLVTLSDKRKIPIDVMPPSLYNKLYGKALNGWDKIVSVHGLPIGVSRGWKRYTVFVRKNETKAFDTLEEALVYLHTIAVTEIIPLLKKERSVVSVLPGTRVMNMDEESVHVLVVGTVIKQKGNKLFVVWDNGGRTMVHVNSVAQFQKDVPIKGQVVTRFVKGAPVTSVYDVPTVVGRMTKSISKGLVEVTYNTGDTGTFAIGDNHGIYELIYS